MVLFDDVRTATQRDKDELMWNVNNFSVIFLIFSNLKITHKIFYTLNISDSGPSTEVENQQISAYKCPAYERNRKLYSPLECKNQHLTVHFILKHFTESLGI